MVHQVKMLSYKAMSFVADQRGATAIEYGLIAGLIAVVIMGALITSGTSLNGVFSTVSSTIDNAT